ncbi:MAG: RDD family protein [Planctomycetota bacterium]
MRAVVLVLVAACVWAGIASARLMGAGAPDSDHGWAVVKRESIGPGWVLMHLPPRGAVPGGVDAGTARIVDRLGGEPVGLAAAGRRLWWAEPSRSTPTGDRLYPVRSVTAVPGVGDLWRYEPTGRGYTHAGLPEVGEFVGLAAAGDRLLAAQLSDAGDAVLSALRGDAWVPVAIPADAGMATGAVLLADGERVVLLLHVGVEWRAWAAMWDSVETGEDEPDSVSPAWESVGAAQMIPADAELIAFWRGAIVWEDAGELRMSSSGGVGVDVVRLASGLSGPVQRAAALQGQSGRLVLIEFVSDNSTADPEGETLREFSLITGEELSSGPVRHAGPVSADDLRTLAVVLVIATGLVLLVALRDPKGGAFAIPEGSVMAEPGRRAMATIVDLFVGAAVVSLFTGQDVLSLVTLTAIVEPGGASDLLALFFVLVLGGALAEAVSGVTLGKRLAGCRVVPTRVTLPDTARLGFPRCLVRNLIKWGLPPAALLIDASGRNRADVVAGAAVVVDLEVEPS